MIEPLFLWWLTGGALEARSRGCTGPELDRFVAVARVLQWWWEPTPRRRS